MCTCLTFENGGFYFGRNLDLESSFLETLVITPRNFPLEFRRAGRTEHHYAMIGMASQCSSFPLYAEAMNEKGLCMAGLYFPGNAYYHKTAGTGLEIASFEVIPWFLSACASVDEAEKYIAEMRIIDSAFSRQLFPAPLHWMMADSKKCLVLEPLSEGLRVCKNPFGVLTNNPPFEYHRLNMNNYLNLSAQSPENRFSDKLNLSPYGQGMGASGLPGDFSSSSRFVRAAFLKWNSVCGKNEVSNVSQFFHILDSVAMIRGTVITEHGKYDQTRYSCCMNAQTGMYYYKTYEDMHIQKCALQDEKLDGDKLIEKKIDIPVSQW